MPEEVNDLVNIKQANGKDVMILCHKQHQPLNYDMLV